MLCSYNDVSHLAPITLFRHRPIHVLLHSWSAPSSLNFEDVDYSDITNLSNAESHAADDEDRKVSRRTRVSFESHPSLIMEDMLEDLDEESGNQLHDLDDIVLLFTRQ